jgi:Protein of unknown function (DUF3551)
MRNLMLASLALLAAGFATVTTSGPAAAHDYPWCIQGGGYGIPGECSYQTYDQCRASASGRRVYCGINPRVAFDRREQPSRKSAY